VLWDRNVAIKPPGGAAVKKKELAGCSFCFLPVPDRNRATRACFTLTSRFAFSTTAASSGTAERELWRSWGVARANALQAKTSQGAHADAARVRALAAYKDFLTPWKDSRPRHPHPERSQGRVHEAAIGARWTLSARGDSQPANQEWLLKNSFQGISTLKFVRKLLNVRSR
jgi:hypothetical protein